MRRLLALVPVVVLVAACGQTTTSSVDDFRGEERAVADAVEELQGAGERGEAERICEDLLVQDLARRLARAGGSCAEEIDRSLDDVDDFELVVDDVTVTGSTARATVTRREGEEGRAVLQFTRVGDTWRAAQLPGG